MDRPSGSEARRDDPPSSATGPARPEATTAAPPEPVQRWRLTFAREPVASDRVGKVALDEWQATLAASGLPIAVTPGTPGRARLAIAAPLAAAASGERELADIWLVQRRAAWEVREGLAPVLPTSHRWIGAEDIWLGAAALVGQVAAADWRIVPAGDRWSDEDADRLRRGAVSLNAARSIPRVRLKGTSERRYDLRPLLGDVAIEGRDRTGPGDGPPPAILARTRFDHELGAGRPDEVVAALADASGLEITIASMKRVGLVLIADLPRRHPG